MTKARSNATANAAKGDLTVGNGTNLSGILAVGSNGDTIVADSSTSTGLRYQGSMAAGKNKIINGGMDVWQRGTSFTVGAANAYTADRWQASRGALTTGCTVSRQSSGITGIQYAARVQRDSGNTSTASLNFWTNLETIDSIPFAGKTVTLSLYVKVGANYSPTSSALNIQLYSGTGTDQNVNVAGFTGATVVASSTITATTSYVRYSVTGTVASSATQLAVLIYNAPTGTAGANDWYEIAGVQLELGSVATEFSRNAGTIQGELAACQRYFLNVPSSGTQDMELGGLGLFTTSVLFKQVINLPVTMRTAPTSIDYSGLRVYDPTSATNYTTFSSISLTGSTAQVPIITWTHGSAAFTPGRSGYFNTVSGYIRLSAEL